jgi:hypothetical protein
MLLSMNINKLVHENLVKYTDESLLSGRRMVMSDISRRISRHLALCSALERTPYCFEVSCMER